jgi:hypothetical protein
MKSKLNADEYKPFAIIDEEFYQSLDGLSERQAQYVAQQLLAAIMPKTGEVLKKVWNLKEL